MDPVAWATIQTEADTARADYRQADLYVTHKEQVLRCLKKIHESISTRPKEDVLAPSPPGLNLTLFSHQRHGKSSFCSPIFNSTYLYSTIYENVQKFLQQKYFFGECKN